MLLRHVAAKLDIDSAQLSKIERGARKAKREHVSALSKIFNASESELISLWLAAKVYDIVKDEATALQALSVTKMEVKKEYVQKGE